MKLSILLGLLFCGPAFADCANVCRSELTRVSEKYAECAKELPGDRGACYKESEGLISASQACMRICNTKGAKEVERLRNEAKPLKPQP